MLYTYFKEIPVDILEAARMDGATLRKELIYVLVPMAVPGIASTFLLNIILSSGTKPSGPCSTWRPPTPAPRSDCSSRPVFQPGRAVLGQAVG